MNADTQAGTRRRLPIGMQTFREVREQNCYYVDKTAFIGRLLDEGKHYFLSRPRRFGKSLLLDTCKELFEGSEALFEGLAIHDGWDWSARHPVLRLSFGSGNFKEPDHLPANVMAQLDAVERDTGVVSGYASATDRFGHMLEALHRQAGRPVAVLVDEYRAGARGSGPGRDSRVVQRYSWRGEEKVYNPFDILLLFRSWAFR
ncbi:MAG: AAA family ATPase [Acidobacteria bacterium]|nr:AAA family ATPase [Acidobacteriota bacterium]